MYFDTKNYLKNNHYHTIKHARITGFLQNMPPNSASNTQMIAKWLAGLIDKITHKRLRPNSALSSFVIESLKEKDFVHYDPIVG